MLTGRQIMEAAGILLQDEGNVRWPLKELCAWVNQGVDAILLAKPSASSTSVVLTLAAGTLQSVPQSGSPTPLRLLGITRNITAIGPPRVAGRMIRPTERALLDAQDPYWHDGKRTPFKTEVRQFTFDEENPLEFYVYPGNKGGGMVEAVVATRPPALTAAADDAAIASYEGDVGLSQVYSGALVDYVCYRAQQKDDFAANSGRAAIHYQNFATAIGIKIQVEGATSPNRERRK